MRALRAGLQAGVDLIEFDVLGLRSGELVLAHSDDLHEVSHGAAQGTVRDQTLARLREVSPELPTLDDALQFFAGEAKDVGIHLDLKSPGVEREIVEALGRFGLSERTLMTSPRIDVVHRLALLDTSVRVGITFPEDRLKISRRRGSGPFVWLGMRWVRPLTPLLVTRLLGRSGATVLSLQHTLVTKRVVDRAHRLGAAVLAWTVKTPRDFARVESAGVDAIVVNDPQMFGQGSG
jgi:glycerophosphoryl diester phosphodiesterase